MFSLDDLGETVVFLLASVGSTLLLEMDLSLLTIELLLGIEFLLLYELLVLVLVPVEIELLLEER
jgi:hypothetical protein